MIDLNKPPAIYWSLIHKCNSLQRQVIVHSIIFYNYNSSCISDKEFDNIGKQLVDLQALMAQEELQQTQYWYCMHDHTAATGFDLYDRLNEHDKEYLGTIATQVIKLYRKDGGGK